MKIMAKNGKDIHTVCPWCKGKATVTCLEFKETKPYKKLVVTECRDCCQKETVEEDMENLDYGVEIACDFSNKKTLEANIRRLVFLNHRATVKLLRSGKEVLSFSTMSSSIDSIEGVIEQAIKIVESAVNGNEEMNKTLTSLKELLVEGFELVITDDTGYSRVCPGDMEYTQAQDLTFKALNLKATDTVHKKISKKDI